MLQRNRSIRMFYSTKDIFNCKFLCWAVQFQHPHDYVAFKNWNNPNGGEEDDHVERNRSHVPQIMHHLRTFTFPAGGQKRAKHFVRERKIILMTLHCARVGRLLLSVPVEATRAAEKIASLYTLHDRQQKVNHKCLASSSFIAAKFITLNLHFASDRLMVTNLFQASKNPLPTDDSIRQCNNIPMNRQISCPCRYPALL